MTEEEIKAMQEELAQAKQEVEKLTNIKSEVVNQRDEIKKRTQEVETKLSAYEEAMAKQAAEVEAERKRREEIATLHATTLKTQAVRQALEKEGVIAVDTALKLVKLDEIQVDESFTINTDMVTSVVTKLKETDGILFKQKGAPTVDADEVPKPKRAS